MTASDEEKAVRQSEREEQKAREIYEEMVLGKRPSKVDLIKIELLNRREEEKDREEVATAGD